MSAAYSAKETKPCPIRTQRVTKRVHEVRKTDSTRDTERALRVISFPQDGGYVPSIRVAGKWLGGFGFSVGDEVVLIARQGRILITKKEVSQHGYPLV